MHKKRLKPESGISKTPIMKYTRALFSGFLVWLFVSISFYLLENIVILKDQFLIQAAIVMMLIALYASGAAKFYYKKNYRTNALTLGVVMSGTALLLDLLITVPLVEIPNGRGYQSFLSSPVLWILAFVNTMTVYFYSPKKQIKI